MTLELIYLFAAVPLISDESAVLERIHELLGLELRAAQQLDHRCTQPAFAPDVSGWRNISEVRSQAASKLL